jgi:hypothetical protein
MLGWITTFCQLSSHKVGITFLRAKWSPLSYSVYVLACQKIEIVHLNVASNI